MSEHDSFIDEVTEEVRRDKLFAAMRRYGWIGILAVVLIVGGAAWNEWRKASARASAEGFGDAMIAALSEDDQTARAAALAAVPVTGGQGTVVAFAEADARLEAGDKDGALTALYAVAEGAEQPTVYRQMAMYKILLIAGPTMDAAERASALAGLAAPGAPFRPLAMEQQVLDLVTSGKTDEALALARQILQEPAVSSGLRRRVTQLIVALGGSPDAA